jgi:hypothetical protein
MNLISRCKFGVLLHSDLNIFVYFITQLLVKEQEVVEKADALKEAYSQVESLKSEITRLRRYEEELANLQVAHKFICSFSSLVCCVLPLQ